MKTCKDCPAGYKTTDGKIYCHLWHQTMHPEDTACGKTELHNVRIGFEATFTLVKNWIEENV